MRWGEKSQSPACLVPLALTRGSPSTLCAGESPGNPTWAGCSLVAAAAGGQTRAQAGQAGRQGVQSADRSRPCEVVLQNGGHEDGWGSAGGPHTGRALRTVRPCPLKSRSESPSTPPSRGYSQPRDRTGVSCISCIGRWVFITSATWEAQRRPLGNYNCSKTKQNKKIGWHCGQEVRANLIKTNLQMIQRKNQSGKYLV